MRNELCTECRRLARSLAYTGFGNRTASIIWRSSSRWTVFARKRTDEPALSSLPPCRPAVFSTGFVRRGIRQTHNSQARREWVFAERRPTDSKSGEIVRNQQL